MLREWRRRRAELQRRLLRLPVRRHMEPGVCERGVHSGSVAQLQSMWGRLHDSFRIRRYHKPRGSELRSSTGGDEPEWIYVHGEEHGDVPGGLCGCEPRHGERV